MKKESIKIQTPSPDDALRVGDFDLLPVIERPPVITSHPVRNFQQLTWATTILVNNVPEPQLININPNVDGYTVRKGTAMTWGLYCTDPSNIANLNDTSNLTFTWKRDGLPLYFFNRQNNGFGVDFIQYSEEECTEELNGVYTCDVTNDFGTTTSAPFTLEVVDLDNNNNLYTNILLNGDGDGGLDGWSNSDGQIKSITTYYGRTWRPNTITGYNKGYQFSTGSNFLPTLPYAFSSQIDDASLFYASYQQYKSRNPETLTDLTTPTTELTPIEGWLEYSSVALRQSIIPNEDFGGGGSFQGFYPGIKYIDQYNRNSASKIRLQDEFFNQPLNYFGRENIQFNAEPSTEFSQIIDVDNLTNLIQGQVGGVDLLTAQFFSYVGCAISRYTIRITVDGRKREYNYFIHDLDKIRAYLRGQGGISRITPDLGTDIEFIPHADDNTTIYVESLDGLNKVLSTKEFKGPTALDVWSIKEKVDWSLMLYPIVALFNNNQNPIKVFGQTYTTTQALAPLFNAERNGEGFLGLSNLDYLVTGQDILTDINAKFIVQRYGSVYSTWNKPQPRKTWEDYDGAEFGVSIAQDADTQEKAYTDKGAAGFFGVGGSVDLPKDTERIRVRVEFNNNSPARTDTNPQSKGWDKPEIYNTLFDLSGTSQTAPNPYYSYGTPRCGITKMKLILVPNGDIASPKHSTYAIPASKFTTLGLAKQAALSIGNDASQQNVFEYRLFKPNGVPPAPDATITSQTLEDLREDYRIAVEDGSDVDPARVSPERSLEEIEADREFASTSIDEEEQDRTLGITQGEPTSSLNLR